MRNIGFRKVDTHCCRNLKASEKGKESPDKYVLLSTLNISVFIVRFVRIFLAFLSLNRV